MQVEDNEVRWQDRIVSTPETLFGKPRIAETRIGVEFLLGLLAAGWSKADILDEYPRLTAADLQAVFAFARDCVKDLPRLAHPLPAQENDAA
ncbi:MAG: DUF433 domain-containing protein [Betaproteobacteria bacterium]